MRLRSLPTEVVCRHDVQGLVFKSEAIDKRAAQSISRRHLCDEIWSGGRVEKMRDSWLIISAVEVEEELDDAAECLGCEMRGGQCPHLLFCCLPNTPTQHPARAFAVRGTYYLRAPDPRRPNECGKAQDGRTPLDTTASQLQRAHGQTPPLP